MAALRNRTLALLALMLFAGVPSQAQRLQDRVLRIDEAEAIFLQAMDAFDQEDYRQAYNRFRYVYESYPLHRKTTAAILMAGKSLYRDGDAQRAIAQLEEFKRAYPSSGYLGEADRTLALAERQRRMDEETERVFQLGIALPLNQNDAVLTQALFNGIRLAVEEHNRTAETPVRMIFRDSKNSPAGARDALVSLTREASADAVIGPLYSDEADAAAQMAERAGVVMVAPLATDERVARGRRYVFQANATITARGTMMARLAVEDLGLRTLGVVAEQGDSIGERMAEGFQEEALRLGADVLFYDRLPSPRDWNELPDRLGDDALRAVDALFLPISGRNARRSIEAALGSLDRAAVAPLLLGGKDWQDLGSKRLASSFGVIYTDDFFVNVQTPGVQAFDEAYKVLAGEDPGRLAYVGYDVTNFVLARLDEGTGQPLDEALRAAAPAQGLGTRIDFDGSNTNQALFYLRYRDGMVQRYR